MNTLLEPRVRASGEAPCTLRQGQQWRRRRRPPAKGLPGDAIGFRSDRYLVVVHVEGLRSAGLHYW